MLAAVLSEDGEWDEHQGNVGQPPGEVVVTVICPETDGHEAGGEGQGKPGSEKDLAMSMPSFVEVQTGQGNDDGEEVKGQEGPVPGLDDGVVIVLELPFLRDKTEDNGYPVGGERQFGKDEQDFAGFHGYSFG